MIARIILVALRNLLRQPFRTFLILQGVIWGTAIGVVPPAVITGSMQNVESKATRLGTDRMLVTYDPVDARKQFDWELVARLRRELGGEIRAGTGIAVLDDRLQAGTIIATDAHALAARGLSLARGRFFTERELIGSEPVCVLEHVVADTRFAGDALGREIELSDGRRLRILGVTASRGAPDEALDELGFQKTHLMSDTVKMMKFYLGVHDDPELARLTADDAIIVPYTLFENVLPRWIELRVDPRKVLEMRDRVQSDLTSHGYDAVIYVNTILPFLYGKTLDTALELNRAVFLISIFVGTSIVCVIMVLSVVERQREIAIRRVEGARQWHIALQFVVETGTVCAVGGALGVPLAIVIAIIRCAIEPLDSVSWAFPVPEVGLILTVVTIVGLAGGLLPAWRAMRVDPVEILRYE